MLRLVLEIRQGVTWGDLRRFVKLGEGEIDAAEIELSETYQGDIEGLIVYLAPDGGDE